MELKLDSNLIPNKNEILNLIDYIRSYLYSYFFIDEKINKDKQISNIKHSFIKSISSNENDINTFLINLDKIKDELIEDIKFSFDSDPACDSYEEIVLCYPGFFATFYYRIAHILYKLNFKLIARYISEEAHKLSGIDIHPGAQISSPFFIDHGTGIVIGETAIIGNKVKIYQGVTLGALSLSKGQLMKNVKRHPTIGNNVTIYSGASILGGSTIIGNNVIIGSNVYIANEKIDDNMKVIIDKPELILIKK